ncbi:MAG: DUF11 domain-containing protein [Actinobacteria bacterium]|nr:DUF11 domain-containing protein [Actinomycetota bacterium]
MTLSLLQPVAALTAALGPAAADPGGCVALDDAVDRLLTVAPAGGVSAGPMLSGGNYGGLAWRPDGKMLATRTGTVGTVDPSTGAFTLAYDVLAGADTGQLTGVAVDPRTLETWVVASNGKLRQVDGWTGAPLSAAVQLALPTGTSGVGDVEVLPSGRLLFAAGHPDGDVLFTTDRSGSGTAVIGPVLLHVEGGTPTPVTGVHGLSLDAGGQLFASTGDAGSPAGSVLRVDLGTGTAALHATATASSIVGLVCARPAGIQVTGTVFVDDDRDATWDEGVEPVEAGMGVTLSSGGSVLQRATTDAPGAYSFWTSETSGLTVTADVPAGAGVTTDAAVASTGGTVDIGYRFASVGGTVFDDLDGDRVLDSGDPLLRDVTVTVSVTNATVGTVTATATTDVDGRYLVDGLPSGEATVTVPAADPTGPVAGSPTPDPLVFTLDGAVHRGGSDLGYDGRATVSGRVWNDLDGDGFRDGGEPHLAGITVRLVDRSDTTVAVAAVSADVDGSYTLRMPPGDVSLAVDPASLPFGARTTNGPFVFSLGRADTVTAPDLGVQSLAVIAGRVFNDLDVDRSDDAGTDPGFAGVTVELAGPDPATTTVTRTTDATGALLFTDLTPGTYTVRFVPSGDLPVGLASTTTAGATADPYMWTVTIATDGEISDEWRFGYAGATTIGGSVFDDLDGDGTYEPESGDTPLSGVRIVVDGGPSDTTDTKGLYSVGGLPHGDHSLALDPATVPSGATVVTDLSAPFTTTAGGTRTVQIAIDASVTLAGTIFSDRDGLGDRDPDDPGLAGVGLQITDGSGWSAPATTDPNGDWSVGNLRRGTYTVTVTDPPGGRLTTANEPQTIDASTTAGIVTASDIGYRFATVAGHVFGDLDGDGGEDGDETGLTGVIVSLVDPITSDLLATVTTGTSGDYRFDELVGGTYELRFDPTDPATAPAPDAVTVTVAGSTTAPVADVAVDLRGSIGDLVFNDLDGDGRHTTGEPGIGGVILEALPQDGGTAGITATTASDGSYVLAGLKPGRYIVVVNGGLPTGAGTETSPSSVRDGTVGPAGVVDTVDIGYDLGGDIVGTVWNDVDGNGAIRAGVPGQPDEPTYARVTVELLRDGAVVSSTITDGRGNYAFGALVDDTYEVRVVTATLPAPSAVATTGNPVNVVLDPTEVARADLGFDAGTSATARVWNDLNGDGTRDAGEPDLPGVPAVISLAGTSYSWTVVTDGDGRAVFADLVPGDYSLDLGDLGGIGTPDRTANPTVVGFTLTDGQVRAEDLFGVEAPVSLAGRVVNDLDADRSGDGDPGLAGAAVRLLDRDGAQVGPDVVVDANGAWTFGQLAPDTWTVAVVPETVPTGAELTFPQPNPDAGIGDGSYTVTLGPNTTATGLDVGYAAGATISGRVWDDLDGDGQPRDGEPGLEGIGVEAHDADGVVASTAVTLLDGGFRLEGLAPGTYTVIVDEVALTGYVRSTDQPVVVTVEAAEDDAAGAIGYWRPASIRFTLFEDLDGDGIPDEPVGAVVGNRTVELYLDVDGDGVRDGDDVLESSQPTDATGTVLFADLPPGDYLADPAVPERYIVTTGNDPAAAAILPGDDATVAVGIQAYAPLVTVVPGTVTELSGEAGDELHYPFRVDNDGNIVDTYALTADSAASVRFVRAADLVTPITSTGPLEPGEGVDLVAIVTVPAGRDRGEVITTTLTATGSTLRLDGTVTTGQATMTATVAMPVIGVTVDGGEPGPGYATPGATVPYAIQVSNGVAGDATVAEARDVVVTLEIGPDTAATVVPGSIVVGSTAMPDATFPVTLPSVGAGTTVAITFDVASTRPLADGTTITVTATATATGNPEGDPRSATAATSDTVSSSALPDADLTSTPPNGDAVEPGDTIVHTAVVGNRTDATDTWRDVVLVADLPDTIDVSGVTVAGAAVAAGDLTTGIPLGHLDPDEYVTVTIAVTVDDPIADATVLTAVFRATGANAGPVVWATSHTVEVLLGVDVAGDRTGTGMAATTVVHPHTVTNTGNVTTTFDLTATTDLGWTTTIVRESGLPNGVLDDGEEVVTGPVTIPPDQVPIHLLVLVDIPPGEEDGAAATTTLAAFSQAEPPAVAEAFAVTEAVAPDLVVDIVADPPSTVVDRGQTVTYTTTIRNEGGADATNVVVTAPTPADATYVSGSARDDGAPVVDGAGATNPFAAGYDLGTLAAGAERTVSFQVTVGAVDDGTPLIDVASVTADDDRSAAGSVTQIVSASPVLDVALGSTPAPGGTVTAGTEITYTATVANVGTLAATGVSLRQAVPDRTVYVPGSTTVDGTTVADVGGTSPVVSGASLGMLDVDGSRTVRFRVRVADPVFDGEAVVAVATATSQQGVSATSATLRSVVDVRPAVSLTGGGTEDVARPGQAVYPHVVRNDGDVTDTFTLQTRSSSGWRVSLVRDDDRNGTWDPTREITPVTASGPLAPGASLRFFAVVEVAADAPLGSADTTTVTAQSVVDPTVSARTTSQTRATAPSLELGMSATPSGDRVNPGSRITYVVAVRNRGAAPATDVVVASGTPAGTVYVPDSATRDGVRVPDGTGADGNPLASANGGLAIASIIPGGEVLVTFSVTVPETATVGAQVTAGATATATATATARASKTHTVAPGPALDLVLTASPDATAATPAGTRITYTVLIRNIGQEPAEDVRVVADTPRDTSYVAGSTRRDGTPVSDGRTDPNPLSSVHGGLLIGDLAPGGAAVTLTYAVAVDDPVPADATVAHQATASAGDATATSDLLVHSVAVTPGVTVTPDVEAQAVPGGFADLAHTVTNTGDVTDAFALTAVSSLGWVTAIYTDRDGDGDIGPDDVEVASTPVLARGEGTTVVVRVTVPAGTPLDTTDVVEVTAASSLDPERTGAARDTITVVSGALRLTKTASPLSLTPGARSTYRLTVRNVGTSPATDVVVTDATPAGTSYVAGSTRRDGSPVADVDGETALARGLPVGTLASGAATTVVFEVETLEDPGRSSIVNSATAAGEDTATARAGTVQPVSRDHGLDLTTAPDLTVTPGTTAVRPHLLSNTGIVPDEVTVTATSALGLPAAVHLDRDGDGILGATDPAVDGTLALAPGEQLRLLAVVHYTADVPQGSRDEVVLRASSTGDPRIRVAVTDVILVSDADVSVTIRATPDGDVAVGQRVAYEVTVTNRATTDAAGVVVTVETPTDTDYLPGSATLDAVALPDADSGDGNPLASRAGGAELGTLAAGATVVLGFVVQVSDDARPGETVAAVAGLSLEGSEPVLSNTARAVVVDTAGLQLLKTSTPSAVSGAGEVVTWTISVMNVGSGEAGDVVLHDPPAAGTRYLPGSTTVDGRPVGDGLVEGSGLALGDLPAGGTRVVVFRTVVDVPGAVVQNVAAAQSAGSEARPLSNVAAVTVGRILPATGAAGTRTLGGAAVLLVSGWMLLYVARPERRPVPVLRALGRRVTPTRRLSSVEDGLTHRQRTTE